MSNELPPLPVHAIGQMIKYSELKKKVEMDIQEGKASREQGNIIMYSVMGNVVVVAGPGTGKTTTMARRSAFIASHYENDVGFGNQILITMTNHAVDRMKDVLKSYVGLPVDRLCKITTIHSYALELLNSHQQSNDLPIFYPLSGDDFEKIIERILESEIKFLDLKLGSAKEGVNLFEDVLYLKEIKREFNPEKLECQFFDLVKQRMWSGYQDKHLIDFSSILVNCVSLMKAGKIVVPSHIKHVLADESQDTSRVLLLFLNLLCARRSCSIFLDPDQNIYGNNFRDDNLEVLDEILSWSPQFEKKVLTKNYRTNGCQLDCAMAQFLKKPLPDPSAMNSECCCFIVPCSDFLSQAKIVKRIIARERHLFGMDRSFVVLDVDNPDLKKISKEMNSIGVKHEFWYDGNRKSDRVILSTIFKFKGHQANVGISVSCVNFKRPYSHRRDDLQKTLNQNFHRRQRRIFLNELSRSGSRHYFIVPSDMKKAPTFAQRDISPGASPYLNELKPFVSKEFFSGEKEHKMIEESKHFGTRKLKSEDELQKEIIQMQQQSKKKRKGGRKRKRNSKTEIEEEKVGGRGEAFEKKQKLNEGQDRYVEDSRIHTLDSFDPDDLTKGVYNSCFCGKGVRLGERKVCMCCGYLFHVPQVLQQNQLHEPSDYIICGNYDEVLSSKGEKIVRSYCKTCYMDEQCNMKSQK